MRASVAINNHNYGRFLAEAIDSALAQTAADVEIVVVDDGSTDDSRDVIAAYGNRVVAVLKENGGQASALNAALEAVSGEVVCFLDADDRLLPRAIERACELFAESAAVCVHWPLFEVEHGRRTGLIRPREPLPDGDQREELLQQGPDSQIHPPTSGTLWSREFLERAFPLEGLEEELGIGSASADAYLAALAPLYGPIGRLDDPHGEYRLHDDSDYTAVPFEERLRRDLATFRQRAAAVAEHARVLGIEADPELWESDSWARRLERAALEVSSVVPSGETLVLIDDAEWGMDSLNGRRVVQFLDWGRPADDDEALHELERRRAAGARFAVVGWPAFWWLAHYRELAARLSDFPCLHESERVAVFDIGSPA